MLNVCKITLLHLFCLFSSLAFSTDSEVKPRYHPFEAGGGITLLIGYWSASGFLAYRTPNFGDYEVRYTESLTAGSDYGPQQRLSASHKVNFSWFWLSYGLGTESGTYEERSKVDEPRSRVVSSIRSLGLQATIGSKWVIRRLKLDLTWLGAYEPLSLSQESHESSGDSLWKTDLKDSNREEAERIDFIGPHFSISFLF